MIATEAELPIVDSVSAIMLPLGHRMERRRCALEPCAIPPPGCSTSRTACCCPCQNLARPSRPYGRDDPRSAGRHLASRPLLSPASRVGWEVAWAWEEPWSGCWQDWAYCLLS